jgi:TPR repeat protein
VAKHASEALRWWRKAAEQGNALAQYNLAGMYFKGDGVAKDSTEAAKWVRKAAEQGIAEAQFKLGYLYAKGLGVMKDEVEAYKWILLAKAQGNETAGKAVENAAAELTKEQRVAGEKMAREFKPQTQSGGDTVNLDSRW